MCVNAWVFIGCSFDLMAVGGASVTLLFQRMPFLPQSRSLWLAWNRFVVIERVMMSRTEAPPPTCEHKNLVGPSPVVLPAPLTQFAGECEERGPVIPELQVQNYPCQATPTLKFQNQLSESIICTSK